MALPRATVGTPAALLLLAAVLCLGPAPAAASKGAAYAKRLGKAAVIEAGQKALLSYLAPLMDGAKETMPQQMPFIDMPEVVNMTKVEENLDMMFGDVISGLSGPFEELLESELAQEVIGMVEALRDVTCTGEFIDAIDTITRRGEELHAERQARGSRTAHVLNDDDTPAPPTPSPPTPSPPTPAPPTPSPPTPSPPTPAPPTDAPPTRSPDTPKTCKEQHAEDVENGVAGKVPVHLFTIGIPLPTTNSVSLKGAEFPVELQISLGNIHWDGCEKEFFFGVGIDFNPSYLVNRETKPKEEEPEFTNIFPHRSEEEKEESRNDWKELRAHLQGGDLDAKRWQLLAKGIVLSYEQLQEPGAYSGFGLTYTVESGDLFREWAVQALHKKGIRKEVLDRASDIFSIIPKLSFLQVISTADLVKNADETGKILTPLPFLPADRYGGFSIDFPVGDFVTLISAIRNKDANRIRPYEVESQAPSPPPPVRWYRLVGAMLRDMFFPTLGVTLYDTHTNTGIWGNVKREATVLSSPSPPLNREGMAELRSVLGGTVDICYGECENPSPSTAIYGTFKRECLQGGGMVLRGSGVSLTVAGLFRAITGTPLPGPFADVFALAGMREALVDLSLDAFDNIMVEVLPVPATQSAVGAIADATGLAALLGGTPEVTLRGELRPLGVAAYVALKFPPGPELSGSTKLTVRDPLGNGLVLGAGLLSGTAPGALEPGVLATLPLMVCLSRCGDADRETLFFEGRLQGTFGAAGLTVGGSVSMRGRLEKVFGLPILHIADVVVGTRVQLTPAVAVLLVHLEGTVLIGSTTSCRATGDTPCLRGSGEMHYDTLNPINNYVAVEFRKVALGLLVDIAAEQVSALRSLRLPGFLREFGITGVGCDSADPGCTASFRMSNAEGLFVNGQLNFPPIGALALTVNVAPTSFLLRAVLDRADFLMCTIEGLELHAKLPGADPVVRVAGRFKVTGLPIATELDAQLTDEGLQVDAELDLLQFVKPKATVYIQFGHPGAFDVAISDFQTGLLTVKDVVVHQEGTTGFSLEMDVWLQYVTGVHVTATLNDEQMRFKAEADLKAMAVTVTASLAVGAQDFDLSFDLDMKIDELVAEIAKAATQALNAAGEAILSAASDVVGFVSSLFDADKCGECSYDHHYYTDPACYAGEAQQWDKIYNLMLEQEALAENVTQKRDTAVATADSLTAVPREPVITVRGVPTGARHTSSSLGEESIVVEGFSYSLEGTQLVTKPVRHVHTFNVGSEAAIDAAVRRAVEDVRTDIMRPLEQAKAVLQAFKEALQEAPNADTAVSEIDGAFSQITEVRQAADARSKDVVARVSGKALPSGPPEIEVKAGRRVVHIHAAHAETYATAERARCVLDEADVVIRQGACSVPRVAVASFVEVPASAKFSAGGRPLCGSVFYKATWSLTDSCGKRVTAEQLVVFEPDFAQQWQTTLPGVGTTVTGYAHHGVDTAPSVYASWAVGGRTEQLQWQAVEAYETTAWATGGGCAWQFERRWVQRQAVRQHCKPMRLTHTQVVTADNDARWLPDAQVPTAVAVPFFKSHDNETAPAAPAPPAWGRLAAKGMSHNFMLTSLDAAVPAGDGEAAALVRVWRVHAPVCGGVEVRTAAQRVAVLLPQYPEEAVAAAVDDAVAAADERLYVQGVEQIGDLCRPGKYLPALGANLTHARDDACGYGVWRPDGCRVGVPAAAVPREVRLPAPVFTWFPSDFAANVSESVAPEDHPQPVVGGTVLPYNVTSSDAEAVPVPGRCGEFVIARTWRVQHVLAGCTDSGAPAVTERTQLVTVLLPEEVVEWAATPPQELEVPFVDMHQGSFVPYPTLFDVHASVAAARGSSLEAALAVQLNATDGPADVTPSEDQCTSHVWAAWTRRWVARTTCGITLGWDQRVRVVSAPLSGVVVSAAREEGTHLYAHGVAEVDTCTLEKRLDIGHYQFRATPLVGACASSAFGCAATVANTIHAVHVRYYPVELSDLPLVRAVRGEPDLAALWKDPVVLPLCGQGAVLNLTVIFVPRRVGSRVLTRTHDAYVPQCAYDPVAPPVAGTTATQTMHVFPPLQALVAHAKPVVSYCSESVNATLDVLSGEPPHITTDPRCLTTTSSRVILDPGQFLPAADVRPGCVPRVARVEWNVTDACGAQVAETQDFYVLHTGWRSPGYVRKSYHGNTEDQCVFHANPSLYFGRWSFGLHLVHKSRRECCDSFCPSPPHPWADTHRSACLDLPYERSLGFYNSYHARACVLSEAHSFNRYPATQAGLERCCRRYYWDWRGCRDRTIDLL